MIDLIRREALAYLRLGVLNGKRPRRRAPGGTRAGFGVLFVPGVAANGRHFSPLERTLRPLVDDFDAFEYRWTEDPRSVARALGEHIEREHERTERLLVIGHSLGGLIARILLQSARPPPQISGFASICAPLGGTWRSKLALSPALRALRPDSTMMSEIMANRDRLDRYRGQVLTVGCRRDQFVSPSESAALPGHPHVELAEVAHAGSLFSEDTHRTLFDFVKRVRDTPERASGDT